MEFLTVGGVLVSAILGLAWYFIGALIVLFLVASAFSNDEEYGGETLLFIGILGLMGWALWGNISISEAIFFTIYYLVIGAIWSIFNYARTISKNMRIFKSEKKSYKPTLQQFRDEISYDRIVRWVLYFPFSIFEYIIGDFFLNIIKKIISMLGGTYNRIGNYYYNKYFG